jgi:hypothetical protein
MESAPGKKNTESASGRRNLTTESAQSQVFPEIALSETRDTVTPSTKFHGTDNPRYLRVLAGLEVRARSRKEIDALAGCANGPDLMRNLGLLGIEGRKARMIKGLDRDNMPIRFGVYELTDNDRRNIRAWKNLRAKQGGAS